MKRVVLDCSVTLSWCFSDESNAFSDEVLHYIKKNGALVPPIWTLEITNGFLTAERKKRLPLTAALQFLEMFARLPIRMSPVSATENCSQVFKLAHQNHLSTYDASYLYLANLKKTVLLTFDKDLQKFA